jgi:RNA polymerase sigma-70 factor (ECF subfamily)
MPDELLLLHRAQKLDNEALAEIHDRYYAAIYRYIAFRVHDQPTAEDLTSEVFVRLLTALRERHAPQNTLRGWLYGVASNVVREYYRQQARYDTGPLTETLAANGRSPDQQFDVKALRQNLAAVLQDLTEEQQNVLALRFGYELPIRDVAEVMGKSEGSVKMLQARAIASLANRLAALGVEA